MSSTSSLRLTPPSLPPDANERLQKLISIADTSLLDDDGPNAVYPRQSCNYRDDETASSSRRNLYAEARKHVADLTERSTALEQRWLSIRDEKLPQAVHSIAAKREEIVSTIEAASKRRIDAITTMADSIVEEAKSPASFPCPPRAANLLAKLDAILGRAASLTERICDEDALFDQVKTASDQMMHGATPAAVLIGSHARKAQLDYFHATATDDDDDDDDDTHQAVELRCGAGKSTTSEYHAEEIDDESWIDKAVDVQIQQNQALTAFAKKNLSEQKTE